MPKPLPRVPYVESPFVLRAELLAVVPHSMATIDRLEAKGQFPKRIRLEPTSRVAWLRREVTGYLRHLAKRRQSAAQEDHVRAANQEGKKFPDRNLSPAQSERSGPTPVDQPANPDHQFASALAQTWRPLVT
jgi:predicted DNA-binding transcriptional regulator AlpA